MGMQFRWPRPIRNYLSSGPGNANNMQMPAGGYSMYGGGTSPISGNPRATYEMIVLGGKMPTYQEAKELLAAEGDIQAPAEFWEWLSKAQINQATGPYKPSAEHLATMFFKPQSMNAINADEQALRRTTIDPRFVTQREIDQWKQQGLQLPDYVLNAPRGLEGIRASTANALRSYNAADVNFLAGSANTASGTGYNPADVSRLAGVPAQMTTYGAMQTPYLNPRLAQNTQTTSTGTTPKRQKRLPGVMAPSTGPRNVGGPHIMKGY